jgi:CMP-N-acetylneuraminic acid synthetase
VAVSEAATHPYLVFKNSEQGFLEPWVNRDMAITRSQDFPPAYAVNGSLYLIKVSALLEQKTFFPKKCGSVICSEPVENSDIDTLFDWRVTEMLITDWMTQ